MHRCTLFGEVLVDIFPDKSVIGGAPFNVARHLQAFGEMPVLITRVGYDELGKTVLEEFSSSEMDTLGVQCGKRHPTGQVHVRAVNGENQFDIQPQQAYDFIHPGVARMAALSVNPSLVYFGTLAQRSEISSRALKALMRSTDAKKFLDVNLRAPWYEKGVLEQSLRFADIVKLNQDELEILSGMFGLKAGDAEARAHELLERFDLEQILVTCGEEGAWLINRHNSKRYACAASPVAHLVDTVGAGDGFASIFILGTLRGWQPGMIIERASAFASAICGIRGAIPDSPAFYQPFKEAWQI